MYHYIFLPELVGVALVLILQATGVFCILRGPAAEAPRWITRIIELAALGSFLLIAFTFLLRFHRVGKYASAWWLGPFRGLVYTWALLSVLGVLAFAISRVLPRIRPDYSPARRNFLRTAQIALLGAPAAVVGYGVFVERSRVSVREATISSPDLPEDLDGLRLVQLSDIHLSPYLSEQELARAVEMANETRAHVALVTGDLITLQHDPLDACLAHLSKLRADAGIFGCLGNHEIYTGTEDYAEREGARLGIRFLRCAATRLTFGNAHLNLAGVDYQRFRKPYLVHANKLFEPGAFNVLLSHNPDVFPVAARQGYRLTIAGHTHGGQVRMEILGQDLSIARFFTPYIDGLYRIGSSSVFVSRGIGTIGLPVRLGSPPEVALLRLCRT